MLTAQHILALMLMLIPPGKSIYSQTRVTIEDVAACDDPSILCRAPRYSERRGGWYRPETYAEGLERYWTIAQALHTSTEGKPHLTRLSLSVVFNESGFRKDVHDGSSISDDYRKDGTAIETGRGDKGASWCLGQFNLGQTSDVGRELVGAGAEATSRCTDKIAKELARSWGYCRRYAQADEQCAFAVYGGRATLRDDKSILARARTYWRLKMAGERELAGDLRTWVMLGPDKEGEHEDLGTQVLSAAAFAVD